MIKNKTKSRFQVHARIVVCAIYITIFGIGSAMAVEEAKYTVELKDKKFELRSYEPHILAETFVEGDFDGAGNKAFRKLFKYISGNNKSRQKVAMTSPVGQGAASEKIDMTSPVGQQQESNGRWAVSFMMPASFSQETIPVPNDPTVILRQVPARQIASLRYSGFWSEKSYLRHKEKLETWAKDKGFKVIGEAEWARYNSPFTPWFMRRNEILLPVTSLLEKE
jgi:hypothetical protein